MIITKNINAYDQLCTFAQDRWDEVGKLVHYIIDNALITAFDEYVKKEFPDGCDEAKFEEFCCDEADYLIENI